ncbi:response regulator transcription factor [Saccharopolyspora gloriosae]|uniref:DNA-binding response OmpR family regulator n=1 Tax=Saccharopolyspora gloriosae TaxID=455344 RepID=A0A840N7C8_9PSEU|nr:response regulator transcription factor [Saccharopolyspora gloriosae]MBB5067996.1 DNA-binding response OmpR family regulator [Saccharopolyspora gloriosae]
MTPPNRAQQDRSRARGPRILVLEDDPATSQAITDHLRRADYTAVVVSDGLLGLELAHELRPVLVVLDMTLPGLDGSEFCLELRTRSRVPVIMLTSPDAEQDRLRGLEAGADDYLTKPLDPRELVMRVQSVLHRVRARPPAPSPGIRRAGDLVVDHYARVASRGRRRLVLTNREFALLTFLMDNPGRVFRRDELMRKVWDRDYGDDSTVTVHMRRLREKVELDPSRPEVLVTVWGVGYRFDPPGGRDELG